MKRIALLVFLGACACVGGSAAVITLRTGNPAMAQNLPSQNASDLDSVVHLGLVFERVAAKVSPAVVLVESTFPSRQVKRGNGKGKLVEESGSGFIVQFPNRKDYYVLTNNHVIAGAKPNQITIRMADQRLLRPVKTLTDPETDIAMLVLSPKIKTMPTVPLGNSDRTRVGQWVLAFGSPFGLSRTVTHGILSARERGEVSLGSTIRIKDFLQTDAAINPGSSGGPLVNLKGEVIGINTAIASHSGTNSGVAFSIPVNLAKRVGKQLLETGRVSRGYLGMQLAQSFDAQDALRLGLNRVQGAWVERVYPQTPAAKAGLKANDVVLKVEDVVIRNENHMINLISKLSPGQRIEMYVWRDRTMQRMNAVIGNWNKAQNRFRAE